MKSDKAMPRVAIGLILIAVALALWQFVFKKDDSMNFSTKDLPASMTTTTPPSQVTGVIPRRSPGGNASEFTGGAGGTGEAKGPPGRR
jgi:hypothetical protein